MVSLNGLNADAPQHGDGLTRRRMVADYIAQAHNSVDASSLGVLEGGPQGEEVGMNVSDNGDSHPALPACDTRAPRRMCGSDGTTSGAAGGLQSPGRRAVSSYAPSNLSATIFQLKCSSTTRRPAAPNRVACAASLNKAAARSAMHSAASASAMLSPSTTG